MKSYLESLAITGSGSKIDLRLNFLYDEYIDRGKDYEFSYI